MKKRIREESLLARRAISKKRKIEGDLRAFELLKEMTANYKHVLSYYPILDEVNLHLFNKFLQDEKRLLLPKIVGESLVPCAVMDMEKQLKTFSHKILEPDNTCESHIDVSIAIIPGIAFDKDGGRLGFGKGHYDRFLMDKNIITIGLCYKEQLYNGKLPLESHDITMERLCVV